MRFNSHTALAAAGLTYAVFAPGMMAQDDNGFFERLEVTPLSEQADPDLDPKPIPSDGFLFRPELTFSTGRDSNVLATELNEQADSYVGFAPKLAVESNWARHELNGSFGVNHVEYGELEQESRTNLKVKLRGRLDLGEKSHLILAAVTEDLTEDRANIAAVANAVEPNEYTRSGAKFGFGTESGRLSLEAAIALDSFDYDDTELAGDLIQDQDFRDHQELTGSARLAVAMNRDLAVYASTRVVQASYDDPNVFNPFERDYTGAVFLLGTDFALGSAISGDIGIGYQTYTYDYEFFEDISDFAFNGHLDWQVAPRTTVSLAADRSVIDPGVIASNAAIKTDAGVRIEQGLSQKLSLGGKAGFTQYAFESIDRDDDRLDLGVNAHWKLNQSVWLEGGYEYIDQSSDVQAFTDNRVLLKMRIFP